MVVEPSLDLGLRPTVKCQWSWHRNAPMLPYDLPVEDPVLDATVGLIGLIGSFVPEVLDLLEEAVLVLLGALLDLLSL